MRGRYYNTFYSSEARMVLQRRASIEYGVQRHLSCAARGADRMPDQFRSDTEHLQAPTPLHMTLPTRSTYSH